MTDERPIVPVWAANAQIEDVDASKHRKVERVNEPRGVGVLSTPEQQAELRNTRGTTSSGSDRSCTHRLGVEDFVRVQLRLGRQAGAIPVLAADYSGDERAVADRVVLLAVVRPVGALGDVLATQAICQEYCCESASNGRLLVDSP